MIKFTQMNNMNGEYSNTKVKTATVNTERVFLLTGVEEALQVILNDTANTLRGAKHVPRLNKAMYIFTNGSMDPRV